MSIEHSEINKIEVFSFREESFAFVQEEWTVMGFPSNHKQLQNWAKYMKLLFADIGQQAVQNSDLWEKGKGGETFDCLSLLPGGSFQTEAQIAESKESLVVLLSYGDRSEFGGIRGN